MIKLEEILEVLRAFFVDFLSSYFTAKWVLKREKQSVKIIPKWFDATIMGK